MLTFQPGIQPDHCIQAFVEAGAIRLAQPPAEGQIQPASLDLRLGEKAYRVRASFLPGPTGRSGAGWTSSPCTRST